MDEFPNLAPKLFSWTPTNRFLDLNSKLQALGFFVFSVKNEGTGLTSRNVVDIDYSESRRALESGGEPAALIPKIHKAMMEFQPAGTMERIKQFAIELMKGPPPYQVDSPGWFGVTIAISLDVIADALEDGRIDEAIRVAVYIARHC